MLNVGRLYLLGQKEAARLLAQLARFKPDSPYRARRLCYQSRFQQPLKINRYVNVRVGVRIATSRPAQKLKPRANFAEGRAAEQPFAPGASVYLDQLVYDRRAFE